MPRMTGGQALVKSLYREGVRVVFGVPGVQLYHAMDALYDERGIRTVDTTHGSSYPVAERALGHVPTIRVCAWDRAVRYETPKRRDTGDAGLRRPPITQPCEPAGAAVCQPGSM